jgi:hypothetical protein
LNDIEIARTLLLFAWAFGLAGIEVEIEGAYGWAERMPTWYLKRGAVGKIYGVFMAHRPLTGYHVYVFVMPVILLNFPYVYGVDWSLAGELRVFATYLALAVVWDYLWFVLNPAYTVKRFQQGNVWWFAQPWIWRFPLDYFVGIALSIGFAVLSAWSAGSVHLLWQHLWMLAGLAGLVGLTVLAAPLYHRWYRYMRRAGADDRAITNTYPAPAPEESWSSGVPAFPPLGDDAPARAGRREP